MTAHSVWAAVAATLRQHLADPEYHAWAADVRPVELAEQKLTLELPNQFVIRRVRQRFWGVLTAAVREVAGEQVGIELIARAKNKGGNEDPTAGGGLDGSAITEQQLLRELGAAATGALGATTSSSRAAFNATASDVLVEPRIKCDLNPRFRFDTYVICEENQVAHAAALSVAEQPAQSWNPLYIYGDTGLGKTHLLHAIGHYALTQNPGMQVAYVTAEGFVNRFVQALQKKGRGRAEFKEFFRGIDILLVDDVQYLSGKHDSFQEEFFHTFNTLHEAGKQVVLTSSCEPCEIPKLEARLRSRFSWGLIAGLGPLPKPTRLAILRKRAERDRLTVPDEVFDMIADRFIGSVRELEGALTRVAALSSLTGRQLTPQLTAQVLAKSRPAAADSLTIDDIQRFICERFRISHKELVGARRSNEVARPRQIAMYLSRVLLGESSTAIGTRFGGRDHTTVLHAERRVGQLMKEDPEMQDLVDQLTASLRSGAAFERPL